MTDTTAMAEQCRARLPHTAAFLHSRPRNPYRVPRPAVISFSGGRTSAYMLKKIVNAYGGHLPSDVAVVFSNTGMERLHRVLAAAFAGRQHHAGMAGRSRAGAFSGPVGCRSPHR